jgi:hypothetical protein
MDDPAQDPAVIHARLASHICRQKRLYPLPLRVGKPKEIRHATASSLRRVNHVAVRKETHLLGPDPRSPKDLFSIKAAVLDTEVQPLPIREVRFNQLASEDRATPEKRRPKRHQQSDDRDQSTEMRLLREGPGHVLLIRSAQ